MPFLYIPPPPTPTHTCEILNTKKEKYVIVIYSWPCHLLLILVCLVIQHTNLIVISSRLFSKKNLLEQHTVTLHLHKGETWPWTCIHTWTMEGYTQYWVLVLTCATVHKFCDSSLLVGFLLSSLIILSSQPGIIQPCQTIKNTVFSVRNWNYRHISAWETEITGIYLTSRRK